ncbi:hypothetical protein LC653_28975 [Nostoc sp. CHAB 5784]|uniref:hypothetical protein n=1 Tax=Nostoc mirabile TaxID=2907820 RepID=UPI001E46F0FE|nr:hypothetical protein [Nostoc mirabile]MCC5667803.1 hypothetical protein [Nostoc mirabile CHAB5784]
MPIVFVHGVASRLEGGHDKVWATIKEKLKERVAPEIASIHDQVWIEEAYWGDDGVPSIKLSIPDNKQVEKIFEIKKSWILRKIIAREFDEDFLPDTFGRLKDVVGYFLTRVVDSRRESLNAQATLFLGDIFTYLDKRGTPEEPGEITKNLLNALSKAHKNQQEGNNQQKLIVISHSMGGQLVYDVVSYFLPKMSEMPENTEFKTSTGERFTIKDIKDIHIDFWCAAASQVGLFQEMKLFRANSNNPAKTKIPFPDKYLNIWWNLWDDNDYLSFTAEPFFEEVFDDLYDSGKSVSKAHTAHFEQTDFYKDLVFVLKQVKKEKWNRKNFLKKIKGEQ